MKKKKIIPEFYFLGMSKQELKDIMNNEYPITINKLESLINRIHNKYPLIDKSQIGIIVKAIFESIRDLLILGYTMKFHKFILDMKLRFYTHVLNNKAYPALQVRLKTPNKLKGLNEK